MSVTQLLLYTLLATFSCVAYLFWRRLHYWSREQPEVPHDPRPCLLQGSLSGFSKTRSYAEILQQLYGKFKRTDAPFIGYYFFQRPAVLVLDTALAKRVLIKDFSNFADRGLFHNERDDPLTGHLFFMDGNRWRALHGRLSAAFSAAKVRAMLPCVVQKAELLVDTLATLARDAGGVVELKELLGRYSTDVIGQCAFGIECNSLRDPLAECRSMARRIFVDRRHGLLLSGFIQGFPELARRLHMRIIHQDIQNFFMRLVREDVDYRKRHDVHCNDFMNLLMELNSGKCGGGCGGVCGMGNLRYDKDAFKGLSVEEMTAQAFFFFAAGSEKSSSILAFALYELALQPAIQERLRMEIEVTLARHNGQFTYECMEELQYMKQVIAETLRKYPIFPHLSRQAAADYVVPDQPSDKCVIRKGMLVTIPIIGFHYDPELYPQPAQFDPERFTPEQVKARQSVEFLPFGDGPRKCIGMRFGQLQMRVGLTLLLQHFRFTVDAQQTEIPVQLSKSLTITPANGIRLRVEHI